MDLNGEKILVVEDIPDLQVLARAFLEQAGFAVACVADGEEALYYLHTRPRPAAIVLDVRMPGMDGRQFLDQQGRDPTLNSIPVILYSNEPMDPLCMQPINVICCVRKVDGGKCLVGAIRRAVEVNKALH